MPTHTEPAAWGINSTFFWLQAREATKQSTCQPPSWCSGTTHLFSVSRRPLFNGFKAPAISLAAKIKAMNFQPRCLSVKRLFYHHWVTALWWSNPLREAGAIHVPPRRVKTAAICTGRNIYSPAHITDCCQKGFSSQGQHMISDQQRCPPKQAWSRDQVPPFS